MLIESDYPDMLAFEPGLSISYSTACALIEDSDQPAWTRRLISLRCPHALDSWLITECLAKTLIRLRVCNIVETLYPDSYNNTSISFHKKLGLRLVHNACES